MKNITLLFIMLILAGACNRNKELADAYGHFETDEIMISAESNGKILELAVQEGDLVQQGDTLAKIDPGLLLIQLTGIPAKKSAIESKIPVIRAQQQVVKTEIDGLQTEYQRITTLKEQGAATSQQFDAINNKLMIAKQRLSGFGPQISAVSKELEMVNTEEMLLMESLDRTFIIAPTSGTVLKKYLNTGEIAVMGKPLLKLADLAQVYLKAYVSGGQLDKFAIGDVVDVQVDDSEGGMKSLDGKISWVANQAEFTPKVIQTKEERINLVYAFKVRVPNPGFLKIGMPGEVRFTK